MANPAPASSALGGSSGRSCFRGIFIALGTVMLSQFSWIAYVFGAFLAFTAYKLATTDEMELHPERNPVLRALRRFGRVTDEYHGQQLTVKKDGKRATPLLAMLIVIESTDIAFAVDSTRRSSRSPANRSSCSRPTPSRCSVCERCTSCWADAVRRFEYLDVGVAMILGLVGVKMTVEELGLVHLPAWVDLILILAILAGAIWLSIRRQGWETIKGDIGGQPGRDEPQKAGDRLRGIPLTPASSSAPTAAAEHDVRHEFRGVSLAARPGPHYPRCDPFTRTVVHCQR